MKCIPKDSQPAIYNQLLHIFDKEVTFFKTILPRMKDFTGDNELDNFVPECFGAGQVNGDLIMCLRDFSEDGFKTTGKTEFHSLDLIKTALAQLGRFHAVSIAMQAMKGKRKESTSHHIYSHQLFYFLFALVIRL